MIQKLAEMKIIKVIGLILLVLVCLVSAAIIYLPAEARLERSILIDAQPHDVFREAITFHNFNKWSPWATKDPNTQYSYSGPEFGINAKMNWASTNPDVGNGSMTIVEVDAYRRINSLMEFEGYDGKPVASIILESEGNQTLVTWTYVEKEISGLSKLFMLGLDGFLGADYEKGLKQLKAVVESAPKFTNNPQFNLVSSIQYIGVEDTSANDPVMLSTKMAQHFGQLMSILAQQNVQADGYPTTIFSDYNGLDVTFTCLLPVKDPLTIAKTEPSLKIGNTYGGLTVGVRYMGDYSNVTTAYNDLDTFMDFYGYTINGFPWEVYVTDPETELDTTQWTTLIYYPIK